MKNINFIIKIEVYPFDIMVSINQTDKQLGKELDKYSCLTEKDINDARYSSLNCQGRAVMFSSNASLLRLHKLPSTPEDFGTMAHEIFHITTFIMLRVGMKLKILVSDEAYAYLNGFITKSVYKEINKYY